MELGKRTVLSVVLGSVALTGCGGSDSDAPMTGTTTGTDYAVIGAVSSDFSASSISLVDDLDRLEIVNGYAQTDQSDMVVAAWGGAFYRIGRYGQDNLTKYTLDNPTVAEWQFSVNDGSESSNPYQLIFVSEQKAYLLRYGAPTLWIINPSVSANDEANFKIGEIDLSAYDTTDGKPEMNSAVLVDGKLYITLQGLDASYVPGQAWVAVIDTATDQEVDTGRGGDLKGIPLQVANPQDIEYRAGSLYIPGVGKYASSWSGTPAEYTGGIEKISLADFSSSLILDDGDETSHPYGQISGLEVISDDALVFRGYAGWGDETLYRLDLTTLSVDEAPYKGLEHVDIRSLELDPKGRLWVGLADTSTPEIQVIDVDSETEVTALSLTQNPSSIVFGHKDGAQ